MLEECAHCGSKEYVKRGKFNGKQRYKCKRCKRTFSEGVHSKTKRDFALELYLNNVGMRKIGKILKVYHSVVGNWIKKAYKNVKGKIEVAGEKRQEADIIELDEIYTYVKKNFKGQSYGLLIVEGKSVLLHLT
jgi:DNA-directed RNA polymerase subunit RPC12/RpoP